MDIVWGKINVSPLQWSRRDLEFCTATRRRPYKNALLIKAHLSSAVEAYARVSYVSAYADVHRSVYVPIVAAECAADVRQL